MIRIDLGKDDTKRASTPNLSKQLFKGLDQVRGPGFAVLSKAKNLVGGMSTFVIVGIAGAVGVLPHVVFTQYKGIVVRQQEQKIAEVRQRVTLISQEINKLKPFQKELESYENQKKLVKERLSVIQNLLNQRGTPVNVLDAIGQALPSRTWLGSIDFDMKTANAVVNLSGEALSNEDVSDYVDKLLESVHLRDVTLETVGSQKSQSAAGNVDVRSFKLTVVPKIARVPVPSSAKADASPGASPRTPASPASNSKAPGTARVKAVEGIQ